MAATVAIPGVSRCLVRRNELSGIGAVRPGLLRVQIVVHGNDFDSLARCVQSVDAASRAVVEDGLVSSVHIAIGDNTAIRALSSSDIGDLESMLSRESTSLSYVHLDKNQGFGATHNCIAANAAEAVLLFLNPDTYLSPGCISQMIAKLEDSQVGLVEARQIPMEHPKEYDPETGDTPWASGCCLMIRTETFRDVGGFDDVFFLYCEDVDLSWRVRAKGLRVCIVPTATVFHDKQFDADCRPVPARTEPYQSALSSLILTHKYGTDRRVEDRIAVFESQGSEPRGDAVSEFRRRQHSGQLPNRLDIGDIATFVDYEFAKHRW